MSAPPTAVREAPKTHKDRCAFYERWSGVWWTTFLVFLLGGSITAAFGSAFNYVEDSDHFLWATVGLVGGVCATITSVLTPDKRADWLRKAYDHSDLAIADYEQGVITIEQLSVAMKRAAELAQGQP